MICAFESTGPDEPLLLQATDEEPQLNPALAIFIRERYKKTLPTLPEEPARGAIQALLGETRALLGEDAEQIYGPSQWERGVAVPVSYGPTPVAVAASIERAGGVADYVAAQAKWPRTVLGGYLPGH